MGKNPSVQHIRIGQNDVALFADDLARVGGSVAVVGKHTEAVLKPLVQVMEFSQLVLREGFRGEEIQRARVRIFQNGVHHRQVVAKRFSRSRGGNNHHIFPGMHRFGRCCLMRVQAAYAFCRICRNQIRSHPGWKIRPLGLARRKMPHGRQDFASVVALRQSVQHFMDACHGI